MHVDDGLRLGAGQEEGVPVVVGIVHAGQTEVGRDLAETDRPHATLGIAPTLEAIEEARPDILILALDDADQRVAQCGFLLGRYPQMKILALAPEKNRGMFYWATVDVRTKPLESSEAGILSALRDRPSLVGAVPS